MTIFSKFLSMFVISTFEIGCASILKQFDEISILSKIFGWATSDTQGRKVKKLFYFDKGNS